MRPLIIDSFAGGGGASEGRRYLSVCSGIEVAALAWVPLGWRPVLVSEIEAFPREVLRIRHGAFDARFSRPADSLALWGDFTALRMRHLRRLGIDPADIDVLVGGTPCQGFSVAGLRGSLSDPRGGLSLAFLRLAHAIQSVRARAGRPGLVVFWENVPGVLSTDDNALGCFLGALVGADDALRSPLKRGRWPGAGMVSGPRGRAAWRVLDAQHFGLAQRRERVFLVGSLGDGPDPAAVLFEPKGLRGHPAPGGEAPEDVAASLTASAGGVSGKDAIAGRVVAGTLAGGARSGGGYSTDDIPLTVGTLDAAGDRGGTLQDAISGRLVSGTLTAHGARARGAGISPETLVAAPALATTPRARDGAKGVDSDCTDTLIPVAFGGNRQSGARDLATALSAHGGPHGQLDFETETFVVAPRLANALRAEGFDASEDGTGRQPALIAFGVTPFDTTQVTSPTNRSNPKPGDPCHPLAASGHAPAIAFNARQDPDVSGHISGPLDTDGGTHAVLTSGVRRLMPVECERLQGVPDHFSRIPWRGRPAEDCPDGPRYRALGNAYPRPVLAWIGRRIAAADMPLFTVAAE